MWDQNLYWFLGFQQAVFLHLLIYFVRWHLWLAEQSARLWYAGRFQDDWAQTLMAGHMTASWLCHVLPAARLPLTYRATHSFTLSPNKRALILILRGRLPPPPLSCPHVADANLSRESLWTSGLLAHENTYLAALIWILFSLRPRI